MEFYKLYFLSNKYRNIKLYRYSIKEGIKYEIEKCLGVKNKDNFNKVVD